MPTIPPLAPISTVQRPFEDVLRLMKEGRLFARLGWSGLRRSLGVLRYEVDRGVETKLVLRYDIGMVVPYAPEAAALAADLLTADWVEIGPSDPPTQPPP